MVKAKTILLSLGLFALLAVVGVIAIKSSNYIDVSQLQNYRSPVHVIAEGKPVALGFATLELRIGETVFRAKCHGVYCVATRVEGPPYGSDDSYAVFLLEGKNGYRVLALYSAREFKANYGGRPVVSEKIVVEGVYHPEVVAHLGGMEARVLVVKKILEGCHKSYRQPPAVAG